MAIPLRPPQLSIEMRLINLFTSICIMQQCQSEKEQLTESETKAEGWVEQEQPQIIFTSSFTEWMSSARSPGSLPPNVGHTLNKFKSKWKSSLGSTSGERVQVYK